MRVRYLVTGGAGFIGSHLTARLLRLGDEVVVLDDLSTGAVENLRSCSWHPGMRFVHGSVTDRDLAARLVGEVDAVFHLAAVVGVRRVVERPLVALRDNVLGAHAVLDAAARHGRPTLIASSSEVYGKNGARPLAEDAAVLAGRVRDGRWAYARSKFLTEVHAMAHHRTQGLPVVIARLFNTIGPRQAGRYGMVVPRFVEQALAARDLTVYGDGRQSRCFCDVNDVVEAIVGLLHEPAAVGESFNVGSQERVTIRQLATRVITLTSSPSGVRMVPYEQAYEGRFEDVRFRVPDTRKIRRLLGWSPRRDLDATLRRVVAVGWAVRQPMDNGWRPFLDWTVPPADQPDGGVGNEEEHPMAEREHDKPGDSQEDVETTADTEAEAEDLGIADEEITERVRGGARAISIPYGN